MALFSDERAAEMLISAALWQIKHGLRLVQFENGSPHWNLGAFGRTDWEYVNNTFVFPVKIGYRFVKTQAGAANGQFCGIGADEAQVCVKVEEIQA